MKRIFGPDTPRVQRELFLSAPASFRCLLIVCAVAGCVPHVRNTIAFDSNREGNADIYLMDADGSHQRRISHTSGDHRHSWLPAWSPDRMSVSFSSNRDDDADQIYVIGVDGSNVHQLTHTPGKYNWNSDWSPDGKTIAFESDRDGTSEIYLMNRDGSDVRQLTHASTDGWQSSNPDWSPDGKQIVFAFGRPPDWSENEIFVMDVSGSLRRQLTRATGKGSYTPRWSPDGRRIVFSSNRNSTPAVPTDAGTDIYVMNADGSDVRRVMANGARPVWSPDGKRIVFMSPRDCRAATFKECQFQQELYAMDADGPNVKRLTRNDRHDGHPAW